MYKQAHSREVQKLLKAVIGFGRTKQATLVKRGELGGDGQDIPFEQAFSNLAHAYLRDKAPSLLDHEVGFQLLDRNQENTKAVGVFGFKVGSHWIFAPVFFLNGDLKGHELLYLKNQDMFVPLKENWLNYILNRKPNIIGEGVDRNSQRLGVTQPDFHQMTTSPRKMASALPAPAEVRENWGYVKRAFAHAATTDVRSTFDAMGRELNLPKFLKEAGLDMFSRLVDMCHEMPELADYVDSFHGLANIQAAVKEAAAAEKLRKISSVMDGPVPQYQYMVRGSVLDALRPQHPLKTGALKVITYDSTVQTTPPNGLTEEDQERLLKEKVLMKDQREDSEVSIPYHVQVEQKLSNPDETGLYEVLIKGGEYERCFVAVHPMGPEGRTQFATVVRLSGKKTWANYPTSQIWVLGHVAPDEYKKWYDGLPEAKSLEKGHSRYLLLGWKGDATVPFNVSRVYEEENDAPVYEVDFADYSSRPDRLLHNVPSSWNNGDYSSQYSKWEDGQRIHLDASSGSRLRVSRGDVFVPAGFKLVTVLQDARDDERDKDDADMGCGCMPSCGPYGASDPPALRPGNLIDLSLDTTVMKRKPGEGEEHTKKGAIEPIALGTPKEAQRWLCEKLAELTIFHDGNEVEINRRRMNPLSALVHLVRDHGFREKTARHLLKQAVHRRKFSCHVKYADPYLTGQSPSAPAMPPPPMAGGDIMGTSTPVQLQQEQLMNVPSMRPDPSNRDAYNPNTRFDRPPGGLSPRESSSLQQAMQTGQKEVFDTAMIGSMLKNVRDDTMVDKYLSPLTKGMDSLGRILFMFYWHGDRFAERYGKQDLPELEDSLRNAFEMNGDVILFLKQKTVEPYPEENSADVDLGAVASA